MNEKVKSPARIYLTCMTILITLATFGCSGQDVGFLQPKPEDLCKCLPLEPDIADYRPLAKHVPIPNQVPQEVSVDTILTWLKIYSYMPMRRELDANFRFFTLRVRFFRTLP